MFSSTDLSRSSFVSDFTLTQSIGFLVSVLHTCRFQSSSSNLVINRKRSSLGYLSIAHSILFRHIEIYSFYVNFILLINFNFLLVELNVGERFLELLIRVSRSINQSINQFIEPSIKSNQPINHYIDVKLRMSWAKEHDEASQAFTNLTSTFLPSLREDCCHGRNKKTLGVHHTKIAT